MASSRNAAPHPDATDGRRARRTRGQRAVTDAMIDMYLVGEVSPTTEQIAERSGVSPASLFRYFDSLEHLQACTVDQYFERFAHLFEVNNVGVGSLAQRINGFVTGRLTLHETIEPVARLARARATEVDAVGHRLRLVRDTQADQIRHHFDEELRPLSPAATDDLVTVIASLTSFEAWDLAANHHQRSHLQLRRAWSKTLERLLDQ